MANRRFSERLNRELDKIGVPEDFSERIAILSKLVKIPKFKAETLLNGLIVPEGPLLAILAQELEVNEQWLLGKSDSESH